MLRSTCLLSTRASTSSIGCRAGILRSITAKFPTSSRWPVLLLRQADYPRLDCGPSLALSSPWLSSSSSSSSSAVAAQSKPSAESDRPSARCAICSRPTTRRPDGRKTRRSPGTNRRHHPSSRGHRRTCTVTVETRRPSDGKATRRHLPPTKSARNNSRKWKSGRKRPIRRRAPFKPSRLGAHLLRSRGH